MSEKLPEAPDCVCGAKPEFMVAECLGIVRIRCPHCYRTTGSMETIDEAVEAWGTFGATVGTSANTEQPK